jgi:hypothetical protein
MLPGNGVGFDTKVNRKGIEAPNNIKTGRIIFPGNFYVKSSPSNGCEINVEIPFTINTITA